MMHMRTWDRFAMAWQQMRSGGLRSGLCVSAVAIGVCAMVLIGGMGSYTGTFATQAIAGLGLQGMTAYLQNTVDSEQLTPAFAQSMSTEIAQIDAAMAVQFVSGSYQMGTTSGTAMLVGVDGNMGSLLSLEIVAGRLFYGQDTAQMGQVAVVSESLAQQALGRTNVVGQQLRIVQNGQSAYYTVLGVVADQTALLSSTMGGAVPEIIYLPYAQLATDEGADQIIFSLTDTQDATQSDTTVQTVTEALQMLAAQAQYQSTLSVQNINAYMAQLSGLVDDVTTVFLCVAGISLLVALSAVASGLLSASHELRPQIGICRAIGARKWDIFTIFVLHAQMICLLGAGIGIVSAAALFGVATLAFGVALTCDGQTVALCVGLSMACGMTAGVCPALQAAGVAPKVAMGASASEK